MWDVEKNQSCGYWWYDDEKQCGLPRCGGGLDRSPEECTGDGHGNIVSQKAEAHHLGAAILHFILSKERPYITSPAVWNDGKSHWKIEGHSDKLYFVQGLERRFPGRGSHLLAYTKAPIDVLHSGNSRLINWVIPQNTVPIKKKIFTQEVGLFFYLEVQSIFL